MPARGPVRGYYFPVGVFLIGTLALGYAARASLSFFVGLDNARPWLGIALLVVLATAITSAFAYWLLRQV